MDSTPNQVASEMLEVVPQVMRVIRDRMRGYRASELSVPEFRTLGYLSRHAGGSLTAVADHIGLSLPAMSRLVDGLVERKLVARQFDAADRRRVTLTLTPRGNALRQNALSATRAYLAEVLDVLSPADRELVAQAMRVLEPLFVTEREKEMMSVRDRNGNS